MDTSLHMLEMLLNLTENEFQSFSIQKFIESFRSSAGIGIVIPASLFAWSLITATYRRNFLATMRRPAFG
ncbi:hypothetical protein V6N13_049750 [Hibiscus sabdariffa]